MQEHEKITHIDTDKLDLQIPEQLRAFVLNELKKQAKLSHAEHSTPDYEKDLEPLAEEFYQLLATAESPMTKIIFRETSDLLFEAAEKWLLEFDGSQNGFMVGSWSSGVLSMVDRHLSWPTSP